MVKKSIKKTITMTISALCLLGLGAGAGSYITNYHNPKVPNDNNQKYINSMHHKLLSDNKKNIRISYPEKDIADSNTHNLSHHVRALEVNDGKSQTKRDLQKWFGKDTANHDMNVVPYKYNHPVKYHIKSLLLSRYLLGILVFLFGSGIVSELVTLIQRRDDKYDNLVAITALKLKKLDNVLTPLNKSCNDNYQKVCIMKQRNISPQEFNAEKQKLVNANIKLLTYLKSWDLNIRLHQVDPKTILICDYEVFTEEYNFAMPIINYYLTKKDPVCYKDAKCSKNLFSKLHISNK